MQHEILKHIIHSIFECIDLAELTKRAHNLLSLAVRILKMTDDKEDFCFRTGREFVEYSPLPVNQEILQLMFYILQHVISLIEIYC